MNILTKRNPVVTEMSLKRKKGVNEIGRKQKTRALLERLGLLVTAEDGSYSYLFAVYIP